MQYSVNYDFGANWEKILPFLETEIMQETISHGMKKIYKSIKKFEEKEKVKKSMVRKLKPDITKTMPAEYCIYPSLSDHSGNDEDDEYNAHACDYWGSALYCYGAFQLEETLRNGKNSKQWKKDNLKNIHENNLSDEESDFENLLSGEYLASENILDDGSHHNFNDYEFRKTKDLSKLEDTFIESYRKISVYKKLIFSYIPFGFKNIWTNTFCITLAKLMFPLEKWLVVTNRDTGISRVMNKKRTRRFDIIEWANKGNLLNHLYGECAKLPGAEIGNDEAYDDFQMTYSRYVKCDKYANILS
jgi:hypothetical protein